MAIDQTRVALDIASRAVALAGQLQNTVEELNELLAWGLDAGLNMTVFDDDFAGSAELQHVDGATLNRLLGNVAPGVQGYLDSTEAGDDTFTEIVQKARRA